MHLNFNPIPMQKIFFILLLTPLLFNAQEHPLNAFKPFVGYTWFAEGSWGDGSKFKQELKFEFSLNDQLVKVQTLGYTNDKQTEYGLRNEGIRQYDPKSKEIKFWEYDIFGGLTEGIVIVEENNLIYQYEYGGTPLTEMWIYQDKSTYNYIVGIYKEGKWEQKFLETKFKRLPKITSHSFLYILRHLKIIVILLFSYLYS